MAGPDPKNVLQDIPDWETIQRLPGANLTGPRPTAAPKRPQDPLQPAYEGAASGIAGGILGPIYGGAEIAGDVHRHEYGEAAKELALQAAMGLIPMPGAKRMGHNMGPPLDLARERAIELGLGHLKDYRERVARQAGDYDENGLSFGNPKILTGQDIPGGAETLAAAKAGGLDMSDAARLGRAYDEGYDLVVPGIHGTNREPFSSIDMHAPAAHDAGHYGEGFYIVNRDPGQHGPGYGATNPAYGEASYYGNNLLPMFVKRGKVLDLGNETGDLTSAGHFKDWASKLAPLDPHLVTPEQRESLADLQRLDELMKTADVRQGKDGKYQASIARPGHEDPEGWNRIYGVNRSRESGGAFDTPEEALEQLRHTAMKELTEPSYWDHKTQTYVPVEPWKGLDWSRHDSLSDHIRTTGDNEGTDPSKWRSGAQMLTDAAKRHDYGSIAYGDEGVLFNPDQARHMDAAFDPKNRGSGNLMGALAGSAVLPGVILNDAYGNKDEQ